MNEAFRRRLGSAIIKVGYGIVRCGRVVRGLRGRPVPNELSAEKGVPFELPTGLSHHEHYAIFRDYLKHEDSLINNRLSWNFTIQGFLFASYTFTIQKIAEIKSDLLSKVEPLKLLTQAKGTVVETADFTSIIHLLNSPTTGLRELRFVVIVIAGVGLGVSLLVFLSVWAARTAIDELEKKWHECSPEYAQVRGKNHTHGAYLPGLIGGGKPEAHGLGFHAPLLLPLGFVVAWSWVLFYALWGYLERLKL